MHTTASLSATGVAAATGRDDGKQKPVQGVHRRTTRSCR
jgi:hypothetical protein